MSNIDTLKSYNRQICLKTKEKAEIDRNIKITEVAEIIRNIEGGSGVNGKLESYTIASGQTIVSGNFVKIISNNQIGVAYNGDTILGVAKKGGTGGSVIQVFVPDV